jgi:Na+-driven multidrug efflux pump
MDLDHWLEFFLNPEAIIIGFFASILAAVLFYFWLFENREREEQKEKET